MDGYKLTLWDYISYVLFIILILFSAVMLDLQAHQTEHQLAIIFGV